MARISTERIGTWAAPATTRSRLALEVASELIGKSGIPPQARISMRRQGSENPWELGIFGSDSPSVFEEVARGDIQMAIINPAELLALANNGVGPFKEPIPVRTITVIPSDDQFLFAIHERTGIERFEDIKAKRYPLRVSIRAQLDHPTHVFVVRSHAGFVPVQSSFFRHSTQRFASTSQRGGPPSGQPLVAEQTGGTPPSGCFFRHVYCIGMSIWQ